MSLVMERSFLIFLSIFNLIIIVPPVISTESSITKEANASTNFNLQPEGPVRSTEVDISIPWNIYPEAPYKKIDSNANWKLYPEGSQRQIDTINISIPWNNFPEGPVGPKTDIESTNSNFYPEGPNRPTLNDVSIPWNPFPEGPHRKIETNASSHWNLYPEGSIKPQTDKVSSNWNIYPEGPQKPNNANVSTPWNIYPEGPGQSDTSNNWNVHPEGLNRPTETNMSIPWNFYPEGPERKTNIDASSDWNLYPEGPQRQIDINVSTDWNQYPEGNVRNLKPNVSTNWHLFPQGPVRSKADKVSTDGHLYPEGTKRQENVNDIWNRYPEGPQRKPGTEVTTDFNRYPEGPIRPTVTDVSMSIPWNPLPEGPHRKTEANPTSQWNLYPEGPRRAKYANVSNNLNVFPEGHIRSNTSNNWNVNPEGPNRLIESNASNELNLYPEGTERKTNTNASINWNLYPEGPQRQTNIPSNWNIFPEGPNRSKQPYQPNISNTLNRFPEKPQRKSETNASIHWSSYPEGPRQAGTNAKTDLNRYPEGPIRPTKTEKLTPLNRPSYVNASIFNISTTYPNISEKQESTTHIGINEIESDMSIGWKVLPKGRSFNVIKGDATDSIVSTTKVDSEESEKSSTNIISYDTSTELIDPSVSTSWNFFPEVSIRPVYNGTTEPMSMTETSTIILENISEETQESTQNIITNIISNDSKPFNILPEGSDRPTLPTNVLDENTVLETSTIIPSNSFDVTQQSSTSENNISIAIESDTSTAWNLLPERSNGNIDKNNSVVETSTVLINLPQEIQEPTADISTTLTAILPEEVTGPNVSSDESTRLTESVDETTTNVDETTTTELDTSTDILKLTQASKVNIDVIKTSTEPSILLTQLPEGTDKSVKSFDETTTILSNPTVDTQKSTNINTISKESVTESLNLIPQVTDLSNNGIDVNTLEPIITSTDLSAVSEELQESTANINIIDPATSTAQNVLPEESVKPVEIISTLETSTVSLDLSETTNLEPNFSTLLSIEESVRTENNIDQNSVLKTSTMLTVPLEQMEQSTTNIGSTEIEIIEPNTSTHSIVSSEESESSESGIDENSTEINSSTILSNPYQQTEAPTVNFISSTEKEFTEPTEGSVSPENGIDLNETMLEGSTSSTILTIEQTTTNIISSTEIDFTEANSSTSLTLLSEGSVKPESGIEQNTTEIEISTILLNFSETESSTVNISSIEIEIMEPNASENGTDENTTMLEISTEVSPTIIKTVTESEASTFLNHLTETSEESTIGIDEYTTESIESTTDLSNAISDDPQSFSTTISSLLDDYTDNHELDSTTDDQNKLTTTTMQMTKPPKPTKINPCDKFQKQMNEPACLNNGKCYPIDDVSFECDCSSTNFTGEFCEYVNACANNTLICQNGGTCQSIEDSGVCECLVGYSGVLCEVKDFLAIESITDENFDKIEIEQASSIAPRVDDEEENDESVTISSTKTKANIIQQHQSDLQNDVDIADPCYVRSYVSEVHCLNGGTCIALKDDNESYECQCPDTHTGRFCQFKNACAVSPCIHGNCVSYEDSGVCNCILGYKGTFCDQVDDVSHQSRHSRKKSSKKGTKRLNAIKEQDQDIPYEFDISETEPAPLPPPEPDACSKAKDGNKTCQNNGKCNPISKDSFECECPKSRTGDLCQFKNLCFDFPCQNHGSCEAFDDSAVCTCSPPFIGTFCEIDPTPTTEPPVFETTTSSVRHRKHRKSKFALRRRLKLKMSTFESCEESEPCLNGGKCSPLEDKKSYECDCPNEFVGNNCQFVNPCQKNICKNGGSCVSYEDSGVCECPVGYTGVYCQEIDDMMESLSKSKAGQRFSHRREKIISPDFDNCVNPEIDYNKPFCRNGGKCILLDDEDELEGYACECTEHFTGPLCEYLNPCSSAPCINSGKCESFEETATCICTGTGYTGTFCEEVDPNPESNLLLSSAEEDSISRKEQRKKDSSVFDHIYRSKIRPLPYPLYMQMKMQRFEVQTTPPPAPVIPIPGFEDITKDMIRVAKDGTIYIRKPKKIWKGKGHKSTMISLPNDSKDNEEGAESSTENQLRSLDATIVKVMPNGELYIKVKVPKNQKLKSVVLL